MLELISNYRGGEKSTGRELMVERSPKSSLVRKKPPPPLYIPFDGTLQIQTGRN